MAFFDRVTDIDDLILNTLGYTIGYGIWLLFKLIRKKLRKK
jgi:glycopeptide antibiotics resistance protein